MPVTDIKCPKSLLNEIEKSNDLIIDFYAEWCGPCMRAAPLFEECSRKNKKCKFIKVNIDCLSDDEKNIYNIQSIPLLKRYKKGKLFKTVQGLSVESLNKLLT